MTFHSIGLLTECDEGKAGGWKWKVNSELQQKAEPSGRPLEDLASEKSFVCKACRKNFHFYCRLKVHEKRCRAIQQVPCKECGEARSSCEELEKHHLEAHGGESSVPAKKRRKPQQRRLPVACDICGRKFAHASGMGRQQGGYGLWGGNCLGFPLHFCLHEMVGNNGKACRAAMAINHQSQQKGRRSGLLGKLYKTIKKETMGRWIAEFHIPF